VWALPDLGRDRAPRGRGHDRELPSLRAASRYDVEANRDLIGLGAANVASGLSGGITTSASAARTAVVEMVGGRSQLASVAAAGVMVIVLLFLTRPLENVPTAALAAVVIGAVLRLIECGRCAPFGGSDDNS
jgi:MFS superfamily sulfate permease-like transporter